MRTYEDVKLKLKFYQDELTRETTGTREHFVVLCGNVCVTRNGNSIQYILGKGEPAPMAKDTAIKKMEMYQDKCTDDVKLEMKSYKEWLQESIEECEKLIACMQRQLSGEPLPKTEEPSTQVPTPVPESTTPTAATFREPAQLSITCKECPVDNNSCLYCKFFGGIDFSKFPYRVQCSLVI